MTHNNIISHIESFLGEFDQAWKKESSFNSISIGRFCNQPAPGLSTYVTFGLSHHKLSMPEGREVRQEFVLIINDLLSSDEAASFLLQFCEFVLSKHKALLRGEVVCIGQPVPHSTMEAIYATIPVLFNDKFGVFNDITPVTVLVWLVPIFKNEAEYIQSQGWDSFESILEQKDPDLWDFNRSSLF